MHILSYRGPGNAGGVSGALSSLMRSFVYHKQRNASRDTLRWWYLDGNRLCNRTGLDSGLDILCNIPDDVVQGHYRYCNNFIWPILHDLTNHAHYSSADRELYRRFNLAIAFNLIRRRAAQAPGHYFIQDYQMSLLPEVMKINGGEQITVFWHVPWPKNVSEAHVDAVKELAWGLLDADVLGFHTEEYAQNFLSFVSKHIPSADLIIESKRIRSLRHSAEPKSFCRYADTEVCVQPLGLDLSFWQNLSSNSHLDDPVLHSQIASKPYVLSVDRADYTKGVLPRLKAIDYLFANHPELIGKYSFVQVCQPSRIGLAAFDSYWARCEIEAEEVNRRWRTDDWQPIVWKSDSVSPSNLAYLYKQADAMLVNPLRDGLNLTAKEFVACAGPESSLLLSSGAGAWHELSGAVSQIEPLNPEFMASQIFEALQLSTAERRRRMELLKKCLKENTLHDWWHRFAGGIRLAHELPSLSSQRHLKERQRAVAPFSR